MKTMKTIKVAINGFGRIGRSFYRLASIRPEIEIVAINDLGDAENLAYLLQYDSAQGYEDYDIEIENGGKDWIIDNNKIKFYQEKDPTNLPWKELDIDIVVESTGFFTEYSAAQSHLTAGAKKVVISAPAKGEPIAGVTAATALVGVNNEAFETCQITSNASCTTNAVSPIMVILDEAIGIEKAILNTIHGYTATQSLVDGVNKKDFRRGRAAAVNMVPTSTGAAQAVAKAYPKLINKFDGMAIRVPVISGSLADITFIASKDTSKGEVNNILKKASLDPRWHGVFSVNQEPLVSSDIIGSTIGSIADLEFTQVVGGNLVKVLAWYDNEMGYTGALVEHVIKSGEYLKIS